MAIYIAEISQDLGNNANLWITLLIAFACGLLLLLLVLLMLRKVRLWYWKVDLQVNTLKGIDDKLTMLETEIKEKGALINESDNDQIADDTKFTDDNSVLEPEKQEAQSTEEVFCISKSGRVFTEKELEELIKN